MAWSWSHTPDGIQNVLDNISKLSDAQLATIFGEWCASTPGTDSFNEKVYHRARKVAYRLIEEGCRDVLIEVVQTRTENLGLCTNGGHYAWVCPYGCHFVSFSPETEEVR